MSSGVTPPRLYRATFSPMPSVGLNSASARDWRADSDQPAVASAHQASDVPQPCTVWYCT